MKSIQTVLGVAAIVASLSFFAAASESAKDRVTCVGEATTKYMFGRSRPTVPVRVTILRKDNRSFEATVFAPDENLNFASVEIGSSSATKTAYASSEGSNPDFKLVLDSEPTSSNPKLGFVTAQFLVRVPMSKTYSGTLYCE